MIRTEIDSMPAELDEVTRRVMQLEIEEAALKKERDKGSQERLEGVAQRTGGTEGPDPRPCVPSGRRKSKAIKKVQIAARRNREGAARYRAGGTRSMI